eukprot:INCI15390.1.p1 GENE.INCI15390.1~~INCI15390.1.p1  ORF type:complete len:931 (+),score=113.67 INCI15390.1:670-3462(+)
MEHRTNHGDFNKYIELFDSPEYRRKCPKPVFLCKIKEQLFRGDVYRTVGDFDADMQLVFDNAMRFHTDEVYIHRNAKMLLEAYRLRLESTLQTWHQVMQQTAAHDCIACRGVPCGVCGYKCLEFKKVELKCSSAIPHLPKRLGGCGRRIAPNAEYFRSDVSGQHWCGRCFKHLPESFTDLSGAVAQKTEIKCCTHNNVSHEKWVRCVDCKNQFHRICVGQTYATCPRGGLVEPEEWFRCRQCNGHADCNTSHSAEKNVVSHAPEAATPPLCAANVFPSCSTSKFVEAQIRKHVMLAASSAAIGADGSDGTVDEVVAERLLKSLTVRVTSRLPCTSGAGPRLKRWLRSIDPTASVQFPYTSKAVSLFQRIDGADVLLFVIYLQEYGPEAPEPNARTVYIAYLDSINSMKPRSLRSVVYQQMVAGYITWAKLNGFRRVYIWSCPPTKNQNYALHCHPPSQRTPDSSRLRRWYGKIVKDLSNDGTVLRSATLHEAHFSEHKPFVATRRNRGRQAASAPGSGWQQEGGRVNGQAPHNSNAPSISWKTSGVPIFAGDFWPAQAEVVIRECLECPAGENTGLVDQCPEMRQWWEQHLNSDDLVQGRPGSPIHCAPSTVPSPHTRLAWLMSRVATRVAGMNRHFMVLDLCVACSLCGRGGGGHAAAAAAEHWVCHNRSCRYTLCAVCVLACGGVPKPTLVLSKSRKNKKMSSREQPIFLPQSAARPPGFRPCPCSAQGSRHRLVHEVLPKCHFALFRSAVQKICSAAQDIPVPFSTRDTEYVCRTPNTVVSLGFDRAAAFRFNEPDSSSSSQFQVCTSAPQKRKPAMAAVSPLRKQARRSVELLPELQDPTVAEAAAEALDLAPPQEPKLSTVFDVRVMFLWFCQKHHLQFDQLRRARFSTQMVFRNLHARIVPKRPTSASVAHLPVMSSSDNRVSH